jgi:TonB family protein
MDNQTHNTENAWVDIKVANLAPPVNWHPNTSRAYAQFLNRRGTDEPKSSSSWVRLAMAAAVLASIGLVVTLLPWQALWKPAGKSADKSAEKSPEVRLTVPRARTPILVPEPIQQHPATPALPQPLVSQPVLSQPALSQSTLSQPQQPGTGTGAAVQQTAPQVQEPEEKDAPVKVTFEYPVKFPAEHVGNGVSAPHTIPPVPEPVYTDEARQAHIQGTVTLDVTIRADGTGKVNKVVRALGYGLDEKAIEAFEKWRFEPGKKDGKPVDVELQVVINFHLY